MLELIFHIFLTSLGIILIIFHKYLLQYLASNPFIKIKSSRLLAYNKIFILVIGIFFIIAGIFNIFKNLHLI